MPIYNGTNPAIAAYDFAKKNSLNFQQQKELEDLIRQQIQEFQYWGT